MKEKLKPVQINSVDTLERAINFVSISCSCCYEDVNNFYIASLLGSSNGVISVTL